MESCQALSPYRWEGFLFDKKVRAGGLEFRCNGTQGRWGMVHFSLSHYFPTFS